MAIKLTQEEVIRKIENRWKDFDFSKFIYTNDKTKSVVICHTHGEFLISHNRLMSKNRISPCRLCAIEYVSKKVTKSQDISINNLKNKWKDFDFSKFIYKNNLEKSIVKCKIHGNFLSSYHRLMSKDNVYGCPLCAKENRNIVKCHTSTYETEIIKYIKTFYNKDIEENNRNIIKNIHSGYYLELDIYLPDIKLAIEFNGSYWHSDEVICNSRKGFNTAKEYHDYKIEQCNLLGIKLIHIDEQSYLENKNYILESLKYIIKTNNI